MLFWQRENIARAPDSVPFGPLTLGDTQKQEEKEFREEIKKAVEKIYEKNSKPATAIINGLVEQYKKLTDPAEYQTKAQKEFIANVKKTLDDRYEAVEQHANVLRKQVEERKSKSETGEIDLKTLIPEMQGKMGRGNHRWNAATDPYGAQYDDISLHQDKIDEIKNNSSATVHAMPSRRRGVPFAIPGYKRLLHEANIQTSAALANNSRELNSLVKTGKLPPPTFVQSQYDAGKNIALDCLKALHGLTNFAGKIIGSSKSDPNHNSNLKKYYDYRNKIFSNLLWSLDQGQSKNSRLLQKCNRILENAKNEEGLLDENSFKELTALITAEVNKDNVAHKAQIENFNERINALNKQMLESAKEQTDDADAMLKWRILQGAMILTPFLGISMAGPFLNVFSNVFMNAGGLGQGIASLATAEYTGPFGQLCELLHIDEALRWLLCDMPVVSNIVDVANSAVSSHLVQGVLGGIVMPLAEAPIVPIAVAGIFSLMRANTELDHYLKYNKAFKGHEKAIREELETIAKEAEERGGLDAQGFVEKKFNILQNLHHKFSLVNYAAEKFTEVRKSSGSDEFFDVVMGKDFIKDLRNYRRQDKDGELHKIFDADDNISQKEFVEFLNKSPDGQDFYNKMLLFRALEKKALDDGKDIQEALTKFRTAYGTPEAARLIAGEKILQGEQYVVELAADRGLDCSNIPDVNEPGRSGAIKKLALKIQEKEVELLEDSPLDKTFELEQTLLQSPSKSIKPNPHSSSSLHTTSRSIT